MGALVNLRGIFLVTGIMFALLASACGGGTGSNGDSNPAAGDATSPASSPASVETTTQDGTDETAEPDALTVVTLANLMTIHPFFQASEEGLYEEANLDLSTELVGGGSDAAKLFLGGKADIAIIAGAHAIRGVASDIDVKIVQTLTTDSSLDIVTRADLEIPAGDWEALKGLTCGATGPGSDTDLLLRAILQQNGVEPDSDVAFQYTGGVGSAIAGLQRGEIDCFMALPGMRAQLVLSETVNTFYRLAEDPELADGPSIVVAVQGSLLEENPDAVQRFVDVTLGAVQSIYDDLDHAKEIAYELYPALSRNAIDFELEQFVDAKAFPEDGRQDPDAYRLVGQLYTEADVIPSLPEFEDVYHEDFLP